MLDFIAFQEERNTTKDISDSYFNHCKRTHELFLEFIQKKLNNKPLPLSDLTPGLLERFEVYLKGISTINKQSNINKHLTRITAMVSHAVRQGWITSNPFKEYERKPVRYITEYLTSNEVEMIRQVQVGNKRISHAKDLFLFICNTGLSYIDLAELEYGQIEQDKKNRFYINMDFRNKAKKDGTDPFIIPLLPEALDILDKYKDHPCRQNGLAFSVPSNSEFNLILKDLANLAGLDRINLTIKIGRSSCGTILLNKGIDIKVVSRILGHSKVATTEKFYAKLLAKTVLDVVEEVYNKAPN
jgi:site-specific recombinase XerD